MVSKGDRTGSECAHHSQWQKRREGIKEEDRVKELD